jgi:multicomponent Na+:H+ antiporter subunit A
VSSVLPLVLASLLVVAALIPPLTRAVGRDAGWLVGLAFAGSLAVLLPATGEVLRGDPLTWSTVWVPDLVGPGVDAALALHLDGLALLFAILVLGIGALVLVYTARYSPPGSRDTRTLVLLTVFAAAMLTLVLADDVVLLYVGWELTSVVSFLLIAGDGVAGSTPARRAFVVTAAGGLCLLAALALLAGAAGSTSLTVILTSPEVAASPVLPAVGVLVLLAIGTKSALVPFGFWLRGAMVAPTPISTYLHAATMVKAGIYLLARTTPITSLIDWWLPVVVTLGLGTAVLGGIQALRAVDLKALLAGSTISQLGFIAATLALGTEEALVAGLLHTLAHAAFKASLFTATGVVDHEAGTRDLRLLGDLRRTMPVTTAIACLAGLSMAGVPPLLGFVSKEAVLTSFLGVSPLLLVLATTAAVLTAAYTLRFVIGTFFGPPPAVRTAHGHEAPGAFLLTPAVVAVVGLVGGLHLTPVDALIGGAASDAGAYAERIHPHLALWHGVAPPLFASAAALLGGWLVWSLVGRRETVHLPGRLDGPAVFDRLNARVLATGGVVARPFLSLRPVAQLSWVLTTVLATLLAVAATDLPEVGDLPVGSTAEWVIVGVIALTLAVMSRVSSRLGTVGLIGAVGFMITGVYVLRHAPDLAITQLLVESLTVVLIVLVFRGLPEHFLAPTRRRAVVTGVAAAAAGLTAVGIATLLLGPRPESAISRYYLDRAAEETGGSNVVNTILVDFRGLDTMGEITVLAVACIGVYVVTRRRRHGVRPVIADPAPSADPGAGTDATPREVGR